MSGDAPAYTGAAPQENESYSLWVSPKPGSHLFQQLQGEINVLAAQYNGPTFIPHVTVLGGMTLPREDAITATKHFASKAKKYRLTFHDVTRGTFFYQCVFMSVAKEAHTMATGALAREISGAAEAAGGRTAQYSSYMPHLSLLYSDIDDPTKEAVVAHMVTRLYGEGSTYASLLVENGFTAESVQLWYTPTGDKSLASWCKVAEFDLAD